MQVRDGSVIAGEQGAMSRHRVSRGEQRATGRVVFHGKVFVISRRKVSYYNYMMLCMYC